MDTGNIIRAVYDPTSEALQVNVVGSGSPTMPSVVRLTDGSNYFTSTIVGPKVLLDVAIQNMPEILITDVDDSIRIGNGAGVYMAVNADGSTNSVNINSLVPSAYDSIYPTYPSGSVEVYTYKKSGTTVATITVSYSDTTKSVLTSVVKT